MGWRHSIPVTSTALMARSAPQWYARVRARGWLHKKSTRGRTTHTATLPLGLSPWPRHYPYPALVNRASRGPPCQGGGGGVATGLGP